MERERAEAPQITVANQDKARRMVGTFLSMAGVEDPQLTADAERLLYRRLTEITGLGVRQSDLAVMGQAYIRAVGRVAAAEAEAIARLLRSAAADKDQLAGVVDQLLPLGRDVFDILHGSFLRRAVDDESRTLDGWRRRNRPAAVAHVDVVGSTALLERATLTETHRLVDGLFNSAQSAIRGRAVEATKYVGDGVFLVGPEPLDVALASLDCIRGLDAAGLSSRAGLAYGPVVHRAGDVFGLPVNLSHVLTKSAPPRALLGSAAAAERLPAEMARNPREIAVRGLEVPLRAVELVA